MVQEPSGVFLEFFTENAHNALDQHCMATNEDFQ